jgi:hypothetical protein
MCILFHGATVPNGPRPPHYRGLKITLRHTTFGKTPLNERSARRRVLYLTTHNNQKETDINAPVGFEPVIQQTSGCRLTPYTARPLGSDTIRV